VKPFRIWLSDDHDLMRRGIKTLLESSSGLGSLREAKQAARQFDKAKNLNRYHILDIKHAESEWRGSGEKNSKVIGKHGDSYLSIHYSDQ